MDDFWKLCACEFYGTSYEQVTPAQRHAMKLVGFSVMYGSSQKRTREELIAEVVKQAHMCVSLGRRLVG